MGTRTDRRGVLHVVTDPRRRGSQAFAHDLDAALRERGRRSSLVALAGGGEMDFAVLGPTRLHHRTLRELRRLAVGADVVVAHGSTTLDACGIALTGTGTPFVYVNIGDPRHWAPDRLRRARVGLLLRRAAAIASVSPMGRDILRETYRLVPERVQAIPNGRRPERFLPPDSVDRAKARAELGLPTGATVLAVVGALAAEKRVALAIEAFALLVADAAQAAHKAASDGLPAREQPDCLRLIVAGEGPERDRLEELAHRRVPGLVTFTGNVADLGPVYRASDALVLSSASEGVPGVLVEAGLTGIPAAATDVGFVRDVVVDGVTGALDKRGEPRALAVAIRRVLADREAMGRAARARCLERHAMETVVDAWVTLLDATSRAGSAP